LRRRALQRPLFAGVEVKELASSGGWIVSSASGPGVAYRMKGVSCDCGRGSCSVSDRKRVAAFQ
jgi:hypothetical protein